MKCSVNLVLSSATCLISLVVNCHNNQQMSMLHQLLTNVNVTSTKDNGFFLRQTYHLNQSQRLVQIRMGTLNVGRLL